MVLTKTGQVFENFDDLTKLEWIETNGIGGWSGSTVCGAHTRRYHGLLMAAIDPPTERMLLVSKLDETILLNGKRFELGVNNYGDTIYPNGYQYLRSFRKDIFPEWIYDTGDIQIRKTVLMAYGENTTIIRYKIVKAPGSFDIEFLPLIAARFYHSLQHADANIFWEVQFDHGIFHNQPFAAGPDIFISIPGSIFRPADKWYYKFNYTEEKNRGLDFEEDLFNHGVFNLTVNQGDEIDVVVSTNNPDNINVADVSAKELLRRQNLFTEDDPDLLKHLFLSADQFIVRRDFSDGNQTEQMSLKTVIAGYHWFTDWSRDTMISLPGLCLSTGRYDDAKKILSAFSKSVSMGMLPNRFQDNHEPPEYNNVDGTLWYFIAIYLYLEKTGDEKFVLGEILPGLKDIIQWHLNGTRFNIHMDTDGLLFAGEKGQQLTWMDARIGEWVVTPRMGKPVEIQALWYNAQKIFENLLLRNGDILESKIVHDRAEYTKTGFQEIFWNEKDECLYDNIDENGQPDSSIRPNQIFAVSLPFPLLEGDKAISAFKIISSSLYTPVGLRSLSPEDPKYHGQYTGNIFQRDSVYHEGTVWAWLLGPYIEAGMKIYGDSYRKDASAMITRFSGHLNEAGIGTVSEIFDGDAPHLARGCIAQAWSVAEILRVVKLFKLH